MTEREQPPKVKQDPQQVFLERSKTVLDEQLEQVDGVTQSRLRAMRREAIELAQQNAGMRIPWAKSVAVACAVSLAVVLVVQQTHKPADKEQNLLMEIAFDDIGLLSDKEAIEFYQELEFYEWLEEQAQLPQDRV